MAGEVVGTSEIVDSMFIESQMYAQTALSALEQLRRPSPGQMAWADIKVEKLTFVTEVCGLPLPTAVIDRRNALIRKVQYS